MDALRNMDMFQLRLISTIGAVIFIALFVNFILDALILSPLSKIPGPLFAALSRLPLDGRYFLERGCSYIEQLHRTYGPVVRVGPSEVVFNDLTSLRAIYGVQSALPKPEFVALFDNYGYPCSFSSIQREQHRERRRYTSKVYTMSAAMNNNRFINYLDNRIDKFISHIDERLGKPTDIFQLAIYFALDNITFMVLGKSLASLDGNNLHVPEMTQSSSVVAVPFVRFPTLCTAINVWPLRLLLPKDLNVAFERLGKYTGLSNSLDKFMSEVTSLGVPDEPSACTIWHMRTHSDFGSKVLEDGHVKSECFDHINAGADTTGATITFLLHTLALSENRSYQDQLREELTSLPSRYSLKDTCSLSFLNNCVYEVLRLFAPGPGSLQQRQVPPQGGLTSIPFEGGHVELPAGTLVGVQPYSLHRNRNIFGTDALKFRPERWQTNDEEKLKSMKEAWIPFGFGARSCIGINVAILEIKAITAAIFSQYQVSLPPNGKGEDAEPILAGVIRPKSGKCNLVFNKIH